MLPRKQPLISEIWKLVKWGIVAGSVGTVTERRVSVPPPRWSRACAAGALCSPLLPVVVFPDGIWVRCR